MADFLLVIITLIIVGLGAFQLGRITQKDRVAFLVDELQAERSLSSDLFATRRNNVGKALHVVKDEKE